jgi:hypothetical protein
MNFSGDHSPEGIDQSNSRKQWLLVSWAIFSMTLCFTRFYPDILRFIEKVIDRI